MQLKLVRLPQNAPEAELLVPDVVTRQGVLWQSPFYTRPSFLESTDEEGHAGGK